MITTKEPIDWKDLQNEVARILSECGFTVEVEKILDTARGQVEIDVYAEEMIKGRKYIIICECKHWRSRVPQTVIHGFRTVLGDIGANVGYIVSMAGFQSGAFKASELTNVELVTWNQFQMAFEETWYGEYLVNQVVARLDPLLTYTEPLLPRWFGALPKVDKDRFMALKEKYDPFGWMLMSFTPYVRLLRSSPLPTLPLKERLPDDPALREKIPENIASAVGYREFLELSSEYGGKAIAEFHAIKGDNEL